MREEEMSRVRDLHTFTELVSELRPNKWMDEKKEPEILRLYY
jgi:hypothetical protein